MRSIKKIIIHTSASPDNRTSVDAEEIGRWHKARGFSSCGYHYVILRSGTLDYGRDERLIGAHCEGQNLDSIGICWVGIHDFNGDQKRTLLRLCGELLGRYNLVIDDIYGHNHFNKHKTCPNIDVAAFKKDLVQYLKDNQMETTHNG